MTVEYFTLMSRYNRWMNGKIYEVCSTIPDNLRREDRGAFFGSVHGILNHLLLTDRVWLGRFSGAPFPATSLSQELYADWDEMRRQRALTDAEIDAAIAALSPEKLRENFTFTPMSRPIEFTQPLWSVWAHIFNHQAHHRGQLTTVMEQLGYDSGVTDLLQMPADFV